jgi:hypothetical protein
VTDRRTAIGAVAGIGDIAAVGEGQCAGSIGSADRQLPSAGDGGCIGRVSSTDETEGDNATESD